MKFTDAHKKYFESVRKEEPAVDQMFKDVKAIMQAFPGSRIEYLRLPDAEFGVALPDGIPYVSGKKETIQTQTKQMTAAERRRANTRYKQ